VSDIPPGDRSPFNQTPADFVQPSQRVELKVAAARPTVTYVLLGLNILIFLLQMGAEAVSGYDLLALYGMKINELIVDGELWRLFTPMFLHGSITHLAFNMYALFIFGRGLERYFGHFRFLLLYLLSGFAGNVISFAFSSSFSLGSSTSIFGLIAAEGVFFYRNRRLFPGQARSAITNIVMIAAINFVIGLSPGIDNWGHFGGLLGGLIFSWFAAPVMSLEGTPPSLSIRDTRDSGDTILASAMVLIIFGVITALLIINRT